MSISEKKNSYGTLTHVSDILWHFIGPKKFEDYDAEKTLARLETYISSDGKSINLSPYTKDSNHYLRVLTLFETKLGVDDAETLNDAEDYQVLEPKCICLCDIPISHLPIHMEKYGDIGIGIRRRVISKDLRFEIMPVRYFPLKTKYDLTAENNLLWDFDIPNKKVNLKGYTKIPTNLDESYEPPENHNAELFETIYEEREWRSLKELKLSLDEIAFILLPSRKYVNRSKFPKIACLLDQGVGLIIADDLFRKVASRDPGGGS